MIVETLASAPDIMTFAQDTTTIGFDGGGDFEGLNVEFSPSINRIVRFVAIALGIGWAFFIIWHVGKPGGARQAVQKMGGIVGVIAALTVIVAGLNINMAMDVLDSFLKIGWAVLSTIKGAFD